MKFILKIQTILNHALEKTSDKEFDKLVGSFLKAKRDKCLIPTLDKYIKENPACLTHITKRKNNNE